MALISDKKSDVFLTNRKFYKIKLSTFLKDMYDSKMRASVTPSPANTARGTPSSQSGRVTITPARNSPGFQSPGIQRSKARRCNFL